MTIAPLARTNTIPIRAWFVRDELPGKRTRGISFHVENDDYFVTLATIMGLLEDYLKSAMRTGAPPQSLHISILHDLKDDLMHLQRHYRIERK